MATAMTYFLPQPPLSLQVIEAHSKGTMTAVSAHPNAPLLATATNNQVVKVWTSGGEQVGVVRAHSSFLAAHRIGPVTCLAFSPYELLLASGSADPVVAVYGMEPATAGSLPPSPARRPPSGASTPNPLSLPPSLANSQVL
jgi:regulator-associated protein of mTOR